MMIQLMMFEVTPELYRDVSHIVYLILVQRNIIAGTLLLKNKGRRNWVKSQHF
jgi:hypothetical protein